MYAIHARCLLSTTVCYKKLSSSETTLPFSPPCRCIRYSLTKRLSPSPTLEREEARALSLSLLLSLIVLSHVYGSCSDICSISKYQREAPYQRATPRKGFMGRIFDAPSEKVTQLRRQTTMSVTHGNDKASWFYR